MSSIWDDPIAQTLEPIKKEEVKREPEQPASTAGNPQEAAGLTVLKILKPAQEEFKLMTRRS